MSLQQSDRIQELELTSHQREQIRRPRKKKPDTRNTSRSHPSWGHTRQQIQMTAELISPIAEPRQAFKTESCMKIWGLVFKPGIQLCIVPSHWYLRPKSTTEFSVILHRSSELKLRSRSIGHVLYAGSDPKRPLESSIFLLTFHLSCRRQLLPMTSLFPTTLSSLSSIFSIVEAACVAFE